MVGHLLVSLHFVMDTQIVRFEDLGQMGYQQAWDYQEKLLGENVRIKSRVYEQDSAEGTISDGMETTHHFLMVEHPAVYTLGKSGSMENVLIDEESRTKKGIEFFRTNRGGDITFHGPGQVVGYPILDLEKFYTDIGKYLRNIEEVVILTLAEYGIVGSRSKGETGVWIDPAVPGKERKICAIGVRSSRWVTMHGFALNVNTNLDYFNFIVPCGISNKLVTSLEKELGRVVDIEEVKEKIRKNFEKIFDVTLVE
jgi:lipoyl(octanoyl) transferase